MKWEKFTKGVFLVNALGIVYNKKTGKILIGKREKDPYVPELTWGFPGGRPKYGEGLELGLKREIKIKTNIDVEVKDIILLRIPEENKEFLLVYYYCEGGGKEKPGEKFIEVKWIYPKEIKKYFATSVDKQVLDFLNKI